MNILQRLLYRGQTKGFDDLSSWQQARIRSLRKVRAAARRDARSGNPAKSGPARKVLQQIPAELARTWAGKP